MHWVHRLETIQMRNNCLCNTHTHTHTHTPVSYTHLKLNKNLTEIQDIEASTLKYNDVSDKKNAQSTKYFYPRKRNIDCYQTTMVELFGSFCHNFSNQT